MKYLTKWDTEAAYNAAKDNLATPQVAYIEETNGVDYKPLEPTPSHDYVEIAGVKWATMNVGASSITDYGNYYQYGKGSAQYAATSGDSDYSGTENPLAASADTATQEWGEGWKMPTRAEFQALETATTSAWTTNYQGSGVKGLILTSKTDNTKVLFFPAAGYWRSGSSKYVGSYGYYWSSTPYNISLAQRLFFYSDSKNVNSDYRYHGYSVRPVMDA